MTTNYLTMPVQISETVQLPYRSMKILGGIQIGLGMTCSFLALIAIAVDARRINFGMLFGFQIPGLLLPIWFIITGVIPFCMSENKRSKFRCQKIAFMVCSILGAVGAFPGMLIFCLFALFDETFYRGTASSPIIPALVLAFCCMEFITAIVSASYCCCCSPWPPTPFQINEVQLQRGMTQNEQQQNTELQPGPIMGNSHTDVQTDMYPDSTQHPSLENYQINFHSEDYHY